jgi:uncharacterized membrane protein
MIRFTDHSSGRDDRVCFSVSAARWLSNSFTQAKHVRWLKLAGLLIIVFLIAAQLVPVDRSNPPIDPAKSIYATGVVPDEIHTILQRSCKDCHSSETHWPWYSKVAPVSWLVASDVHDGRKELNLSEWASYTDKRKDHKLDSICEQVKRGDMPDGKYTLIHTSAKLSDGERTEICKWTEEAGKKLSAQQPSPAAK